MTRAHATSLRRALDVVFLVSGLVISVLAATILTSPRQSDAYFASSLCAQPADAFHERCYTFIPSTGVAAVVHHGKIGPSLPQVTVTSATLPTPILLNIVRPSQFFYDLRDKKLPSKVFLKVWDGTPTAVFTSLPDGTINNGGGMLSDAHPQWRDSLDTWAGFSLLGVGLALLLVHPVWWLMPRPLRERLQQFRPHWTSAVGGIRDLFTHRRLMVAAVALVALNLLDIATSILGGRYGLYEANPVAWEMVFRWGPLGGFFSLKLPALLAIIMVMTKLPVRAALGVAWLSCGVMVWVVISNVQLVWSSVPTA